MYIARFWQHIRINTTKVENLNRYENWLTAWCVKIKHQSTVPIHPSKPSGFWNRASILSPWFQASANFSYLKLFKSPQPLQSQQMAGFRTDEFPEELTTHQDPAKWVEQGYSMHFHAGPMFKINEFLMVIYSILCSWSTPHLSNNNNMHNKQSEQQTWTTATKQLLAKNTFSDLSLESWNPKYLEKKTVETAVQTTSPTIHRLFQVEKRSQEPTSMSTTSTFTASDVVAFSCSDLISPANL